MTTTEAIRLLYDDIVCELSFCKSTEEILNVIDEEFEKTIKHHESQESTSKRQNEKQAIKSRLKRLVRNLNDLVQARIKQGKSIV